MNALPAAADDSSAVRITDGRRRGFEGYERGHRADHFRALVAASVAGFALWTGSMRATQADEHASHHPPPATPDAATMPAPTPSAPGMIPPAPPPPAAPESGVTPPPGVGMGEMMGKMMDKMMAAPGGAAVPVAPVPGSAMPASGAAAPAAAGGMAGMPAPPAAGSDPATAGAVPATAAPGGCMGGGCGGAIAKTPIYSSLMTLPALTPEKRAEIDSLASQQMSEGKARVDTGLVALNRATLGGDNQAMQLAVGLMHEGLDELGAGIAARRVLAEGKAPRNLALDWFKREMNLASPIATGTSAHSVTPFHLFTMGLLIVFSLAMLLMYFFKMRRAAALFGRINPDPGSAPPGSSAPLGGAPKPPPAPPSSAPTPPAAAVESTGRPAVALKVPDTPSPPRPPTDSLSGSLRARPDSGAGLPASANWRGQLRIGSIILETPSVKTLRLLPASNEDFLPFTFVPGQFMNLAFWIGGARMNRSYSISSSPTKRDYLDLTVRREPRGAVSRHIDDLLKVGDKIEAGGPVGKFTFTGTEADSIVLIAGGVGITPMMSISRYLTEHAWPGEIFLFYACRAPQDFIFAKQIAALEKANAKLHVIVIMSDAEGTDWRGPRGRLSKEIFTQAVPDLASRRIHLCGPPAMMEAVKAVLKELGVPAEQVKTESFGTVKPIPIAAGSGAKPASAAIGPTVTFSKNSKSAKVRTDLKSGDTPPLQSLLELSEELSIPIEFSCRVGTCGVCKTKMTSGEVDQAVQDALDDEDKVNGIILACQAKPKNDITVDA